jgi:putative membrane protein
MFSLSKSSCILGAAAFCLAFAVSVSAQNKTPGGHYYASSTSSSSDTTFAKKAAEGGMAEVKFGQLAQEKGSSQAVKDFGKRMVTDHSKIDDQLKDVASKDSITLPAKLDAADQATYDRLSKLSGPAFDRAYARDMVRDHETDISQFKMEAADGHNSDLKNFASQTASTLESHLQLAKQMQQTVSGTSTPGAE